MSELNWVITWTLLSACLAELNFIQDAYIMSTAWSLITVALGIRGIFLIYRK